MASLYRMVQATSSPTTIRCIWLIPPVQWEYQDGLASYLGVSGYDVEFRFHKNPTSGVHGPSQVRSRDASRHVANISRLLGASKPKQRYYLVHTIFTIGD